MTRVVAGIEDAITARLDTAVGAHVRETGSMPGPWSAELLKRLLQRAPGAYVSWLGGKVRDGEPDPVIDARVDVIVVTKNARGEAARRRGGPTEIGAYDLIETVVPALHAFTPGEGGALRLDEVRNVFNEATFDLGATVYVASWRCPVVLPVELDPAALADFATYHSEHDVAPADDDVQTTDQEVEMPQ